MLCSGKMTVEVNFSRVGSAQVLLQDIAVWGVNDKSGIAEKPFEHIYMTKWARAGEDKVMGTYTHVRTTKVGGDFCIIPTANTTEGSSTERECFQYSFDKYTTVLVMDRNCGLPGNVLQIGICSDRVCTQDCKAFCQIYA